MDLKRSLDSTADSESREHKVELMNVVANGSSIVFNQEREKENWIPTDDSSDSCLIKEDTLNSLSMEQPIDIASDNDPDEMCVSSRLPYQAHLVQGSTHQIVVIHCNSSSHIVGRLVSFESDYYQMLQNVDVQGEINIMGPFSFEAGTMVCAKVPNLGWKRAFLLSTEKEQARIYMCDVGHNVIVSLNNL